MHSTNKSLLWLGLASALALGACVDENVAEVGEPPPPAPGPCGKNADGTNIARIGVPVFMAGTGTPVIYAEGRTPKTPAVFFTIPDEKDAAKNVVVATGEAGGPTFASVPTCPGKTLALTAWLGDTFADAMAKPEDKEKTKLGTLTTPAVDAMKPFTIVGGGIVDKAAADKHSIVAPTLYKLFTVDQSVFTAGKDQIIVVNASARLGNATADVNGTAKPANLFEASAPIDVAVDGKPVVVKLKGAGDVTKSVTISPRFPTGTQATLFLYDSVENDSKVPVAEADKPTSAAFVTAKEILFSKLPDKGVTFEVSE